MPKVVQYGRVQRLSYSRIDEPIELPNLIQVQLSSYRWFIEKGLRKPCGGLPYFRLHRNLELDFIDYSLGEPKYDDA